MLFSYDTETTGLSTWQGAEMFAFSSSDKEGHTRVLRLDAGSNEKAVARAWLNDLFDDHTLTLFNAKFDFTFTKKFLGKNAFRFPRKFHDVQTQLHILDSDRTKRSLKQVAWELGGYPRDDEEAVKKSRIKNYSLIPRRLMDWYQQCDAERTMLTHLTLYPSIKSNSDYLNCYRVELNLIKTTMQIEERGVRISIPKTEKMLHRLYRKADSAYRAIQQEANEPINPSSDKELVSLLFKKMKMPIVKTTKSGAPSIDKEALLDLYEVYKHPILDLILQYRSYSGAASMLKGYLRLADGEGILHPNIRTVGTKTGRESSADPNIQNVQKETSPRNLYPVPIRKVFYPRRGYAIFLIDYSGMEMRGLVHYSGDPVMTKAFQEGGDPHDLAAIVWYGTRYIHADAITKKVMRGAAKNANFAIHYGATIRKVALLLSLPLEDVTSKWADYHRAFPGVKALFRNTRRQVQEKGCVFTLFGRKIDVPHAKPYVGVNYLVQGSCSEIMKRGQIRVQDYLRHETNGEASIIFPVHDESAIEYPLDLMPKAKMHLREVAHLMTNFPQLRIPMDVECKVTYKSWADAVPFDLN